MPQLAMPSSGLLNRQLGKMGLAAKASSTLFSPAQMSGMAPPQFTSMAFDRFDTSLNPTKMTDLSQPDFGWGSHAAQAPPFPGSSGQSPFGGQQAGYTGGAAGNVGGDWSGVEQWSSAINAAAAQYGVDPNLIKAIMKLESNGDPNASGAAGVWGPMQVNANAWGQGPWMNDPVANIMKGAEILKTYLDENGGNVREALRHYHGIGSDGYTTDQSYADIVLGNYQQLQSGGGATTGTSGGDLTSMFGSFGNVPGWGEFDAPSNLGYYSYGTQYGMNGTNHTGVDVPMPVGTAYRAPMGGVVTCSGTGVGPGADGGGCAAFADTLGNGAGRVEVRLDNGVVLIYGHSSGAALRPGQRFSAGTVLGWSGGMNSPHVHLEARVVDPSTPSGYRIVDPRSVVGGAAGSAGGYGGGYAGGGAASGQSPGMSWQDIFRQFATVR